MNWTYRFITSLIGFGFLFLVMVNMLMAFDLVYIIPFDTGNSQTLWTDKYFGVSTLLNAFNTHFGKLSILEFFTTALKTMRDFMGRINLNNAFVYMDDVFGAGIEVTKLSSSLLGDALNALVNLVSILFSVYNLLANIPYIVVAVVYFFVYLVYIVSIALQFLIFLLYLLGGGYYSTIPTYPKFDIEPFIIVTNSFAL